MCQGDDGIARGIGVSQAESERDRWAFPPFLAPCLPSPLATTHTAIADRIVQLKWELGSSVFGLLLRHFAPDDTYTVTKLGTRLRIDGSLMGLDRSVRSVIPRWRRGKFSLLIDAEPHPAPVRAHPQAFVVLLSRRAALGRDATPAGGRGTRDNAAGHCSALLFNSPRPPHSRPA